ncbi:glycosyl hydrolase family 28-related protein [uncultured Leifsonia sp.]|uniref:glycosyl hydrolase family 28-related protein n=1 Tax=uncultured Leifsonia sp. TaxID=340359 RepID=UPI0028D09B1A|nr:glycosyl hydrolase family 28-related protein [uncultured Leifsonia sp.]
MDHRTASYDVTAFGADGTGSRDSTAAIRAAIAAACAASGDAVVRFPPGRYAVWPEDAAQRELYVTNTVGADPRFRVKTIAVLIEDARNLTLLGEDAVLVVHGRQTAIAVIDSADIAVRGLTIDYAVPTVVDATVRETGVAGGAGYRVVSIPEANPFEIDGLDVVWQGGTSPVTGEAYWEGRNGMAYTQVHDPIAGRTWRVDGSPLFDGVAALSRRDRLLRIEYASGGDPGDAGLVHQMRDTVRDHPGILVLDSARITLARVQARFLHGLGVVAQRCRDVTVEAVAFQAPREEGRSSAAFADFLQLAMLEGEVVVRDCVFDGPHDDPINIHGTYLRVADAGTDAIVLSFPHPESAGFPVFSAGDRLELVDAETLQALSGPLTVRSVDGPSGRDHAKPLTRMTIALADPLPEGLAGRAGMVAENITRTPSVEVAGNRFVHIPTRAILVTTRRRVRIHGNLFDGVTMPSIFISADATEWFESGPVSDVTIAGNSFRRTTAPAILVRPTVGASMPVHGRIAIEANRFEDAAAPLVDARNVAELVFQGNETTVPIAEAVRADAVGRLVTDPRA